MALQRLRQRDRCQAAPGRSAPGPPQATRDPPTTSDPGARCRRRRPGGPADCARRRTVPAAPRRRPGTRPPAGVLPPSLPPGRRGRRRSTRALLLEATADGSRGGPDRRDTRSATRATRPLPSRWERPSPRALHAPARGTPPATHGRSGRSRTSAGPARPGGTRDRARRHTRETRIHLLRRSGGGASAGPRRPAGACPPASRPAAGRRALRPTEPAPRGPLAPGHRRSRADRLPDRPGAPASACTWMPRTRTPARKPDRPRARASARHPPRRWPSRYSDANRVNRSATPRASSWSARTGVTLTVTRFRDLEHREVGADDRVEEPLLAEGIGPEALHVGHVRVEDDRQVADGARLAGLFTHGRSPRSRGLSRDRRRATGSRSR